MRLVSFAGAARAPRAGNVTVLFGKRLLHRSTVKLFLKTYSLARFPAPDCPSSPDEPRLRLCPGRPRVAAHG
jgi:hypothetical protein